MNKMKTLPRRSEVKAADAWDLSSLFAADEEWEGSFAEFEKLIPNYAEHRGQLSQSAAALAACLEFDSRVERLAERLGTYALLKTAEDQANSTYQRMRGRFHSAGTRAAEAASFIRPEILAIANNKIDKFLAAEEMRPYQLRVQRLLRFKKHTLSRKEEQLLAMQGEMAQAAGEAFRQLLDADLKFGAIKNDKGEYVELSNATFSQFLISPRRRVRKTAFHQYYSQFVAHENTLAATLNGSIQKDVYYARARGYESSLAAALYTDNVPESLYDNLIESVRRHLPAVHHYYDVRRRKMRLKDIHHYDTYVPILSEIEVRHSWKQAVNLICSALEPLGHEYCGALEEGLQSGWCDRYPNQGKRSGAFSCGSFDGAPYILMNFKPDVLDDVFTLAHEAGHSMHSWYSARHQSFEYYDYVIFVAEVASTFNELMLNKYMLDRANDDEQRAYLINREIDSIRATVVRQTMFAEFEKVTHAMVEAGEPLTVDAFKSVYRGLLEDYFGAEFVLDQELSLECLRVPHFYHSFYVYQYATGFSAAIALTQRVLQGGGGELQDYLSFLKGGGSKFPLDLLRDAGVDMERPEPVDTALTHFESLVTELGELL